MSLREGNVMERIRETGWAGRIAAIFAVAVLLTACGNGGDGDPTATSEPPTAPVVTSQGRESASTPTGGATSGATETTAGTGVTAEAAATDTAATTTSTPMTSGDSTPTQPSDVISIGSSPSAGTEATQAPSTPLVVSTPAGQQQQANTPVATPTATETPATQAPSTPSDAPAGITGDGTGGTGVGQGTQDVAATPAASPAASPVATPVATLTVRGCEVQDVPPFRGDTNQYVLTADVNFRAGPGATCDLAQNEPIGEGQTVTVVGGPVTQAEDDSVWLQVEVNGQTGWMSEEFLEPSGN